MPSSIENVVNALSVITQDVLTKFLKNATLSMETSAKRICKERNPELYFILELKYMSKENLDWIFYDLPKNVNQSMM